MSIGVAWLMRHRGVPNGYSTASSYQVPTSSKYYSTPMSFLVGIGVIGICGVGECKCLFYDDFLQSAK